MCCLVGGIREREEWPNIKQERVNVGAGGCLGSPPVKVRSRTGAAESGRVHSAGPSTWAMPSRSGHRPSRGQNARAVAPAVAMLHQHTHSCDTIRLSTCLVCSPIRSAASTSRSAVTRRRATKQRGRTSSRRRRWLGRAGACPGGPTPLAATRVTRGAVLNGHVPRDSWVPLQPACAAERPQGNGLPAVKGHTHQQGLCDRLQLGETGGRQLLKRLEQMADEQRLWHGRQQRVA